MARARFLTDEWFEQVRALANGSGSKSGVSARLAGVISGGPDGEVKCRLVIDAGTLVSADRGVADDADLTLTVGYDDAVAIQKAALTPSVAYMQGRLKSAGDTGLLLKLLPLTASAEYEALRQQVDAVTEY